MGEPTIINNFIGGSYVPPAQGRYMDVLNPATDEVIGRVAVSTDEDVQAAVARAKEVCSSPMIGDPQDLATQQ